MPPPQRSGRCGYVTAGSVGTTCPDCGFDLTKSAYLRCADRTWLRTIVGEIQLIRIGAIGLLSAAHRLPRPWRGRSFDVTASEPFLNLLKGTKTFRKELERAAP